MFIFAIFQNLHVLELLTLVLMVLAFVIPIWVIFKRIGWPPALAFFAAIPGVLILILYAVAFLKWKNGGQENKKAESGHAF